VSTILEVQNRYLDRLYEIYGAGNKEVIKNLGLTQDETNQIFEQVRFLSFSDITCTVVVV
jgi:hypothetical protein